MKLLKKICREQFYVIPYTSKHVFRTDNGPHNNPTNCKKCGLSYNKWLDKIQRHFIKLK